MWPAIVMNTIQTAPEWVIGWRKGKMITVMNLLFMTAGDGFYR